MSKIFACMSMAIFSFLGAEEGMWPFHQIPKKQIESKYGTCLSDDWILHVQKSCLRVSTGGSASFISPKGLVMTNHHVGAFAIHNLSSGEHNYFEEGFYAEQEEKELPCANVYMDCLVRTYDVTDQVNAKANEATSFAEKEKLRKEAMAKIQKTAQEQTGLQPEIVTLYHGAKYYLYLYERYSDIRLVMAPESCMASFGGDIDNFEYPRYSFDVCFFRVYKDGKPLNSADYLPLAETGPKEKELLFVSGHPGRTKRMWTSEHLRFSKEIEIPCVVRFLDERLAMLDRFASKNEESKRISAQIRHSLANAYKVYKGLEKALNEERVLDAKKKEEELLSQNSLADELSPWKQIQSSLEDAKSYLDEYFVLEGLGSRYSKLYNIAKHLVRLSEEIPLSNEQRLPEYVDTELAKLEGVICSEEPFYPDLELACLTDSLERLSSILGKEHPLIKNLLCGKSPSEVAETICLSTKLYDLSFRKDLLEHFEKTTLHSDPLLVFARLIDTYARLVRKQKEERFDAIQTECYAWIAQESWRHYEESLYPDATFTLRLSLGEMKGYQDLPPKTVLAGLYEHAQIHGEEFPYAISKRWLEAKTTLALDAGLNFVTTHDIIGGNSGSPVFNVQGQCVGVIFDGNADSIAWSHKFDDTIGRSISVHAQGIVEVLDKIYHAERLVQEIRNVP